MNNGTYLFAVSAICACVLTGCVGSVDGSATSILTESEAKDALRQLPYRYRFRPVDLPDGAETAIAGTAFGPHDTVLHFGVAFGRSTDGVPVPRAGTSESFGYRETFLYTDDLQLRNAKGKLIPNPQFKTPRQWRAAIDMEVEITDRLCKAATGESCPV